MSDQPKKHALPEINTAAAPEVNLIGAKPRIAFQDVTLRILPLRAKMDRLQQFCDNFLNFADEHHQLYYFQPAAPFVMLQVLNYGRMTTETQNLGWISQNELGFGIWILPKVNSQDRAFLFDPHTLERVDDRRHLGKNIGCNRVRDRWRGFARLTDVQPMPASPHDCERRS